MTRSPRRQRPASDNNLTPHGPRRPRPSSWTVVRNPLRNGRAEPPDREAAKVSAVFGRVRWGRAARRGLRRVHRADSGGETTVASTSDRSIARSSQGPTRARALFLTTLLAAALQFAHAPQPNHRDVDLHHRPGGRRRRRQHLDRQLRDGSRIGRRLLHRHEGKCLYRGGRRYERVGHLGRAHRGPLRPHRHRARARGHHHGLLPVRRCGRGEHQRVLRSRLRRQDHDRDREQHLALLRLDRHHLAGQRAAPRHVRGRDEKGRSVHRGSHLHRAAERRIGHEQHPYRSRLRRPRISYRRRDRQLPGRRVDRAQPPQRPS